MNERFDFTEFSMSKRILIALTSHANLGTTGKKTGYYLSEVSHPVSVFAEAGFQVDFVSPQGGEPPMDGINRTDPLNAAFLDDADRMRQVKNTVRPDAIDPSQYDAIVYAGGHGTMWDFPEATGLEKLAAAIYEKGGVVAAVCHGPAGLVPIRLSNGKPLVEGHRVTSFTNEEEQAVNLTGVVPFLLESKLTELGATFVGAPTFSAHVVTSGRLVTGQNPASAKGIAEAVVQVLREA